MDTTDNIRRLADRHEATAANNLKTAQEALTRIRETLARIDATGDLTASHADAAEMREAAWKLQWCIRHAIYAYRDLELAEIAEADQRRHDNS